MAEMPTADERGLIQNLEARLNTHSGANKRVGKFYDENYRVRSLGVIPEMPQLRRAVVGWGTTVVDTLEERINLTGWRAPQGDADSRETLHDLFSISGAEGEAHQAHLDALIYGIGFVTVTAGGPGEPPVLIRAHSATSATAKVDPRTGLATAALTRNSETSQTVWTPEVIIEMTRATETAVWQVAERIPNSMGRCLVVPLVNRSRAGDRRGRSEITPAIRAAIESATRALKAMDVNREFFSAPQRNVTNMSPDQFVGADGQQMSGWQLASAKMLVAPPDDDGAEPHFGEFSTISPGPYLDQIRGLAGLVATEAGIPSSYLGIETSNPSSADAIRMLESRLVTRAKRRTSMLSPAWAEVGRLALAIYTSQSVDDMPYLTPSWTDPGTPTTAATVDAMTKLIQVGAIPATSEMVWERAGFTEDERRQLRAEVARAEQQQRLSTLSAIMQTGQPTGALVGMTEVDDYDSTGAGSTSGTDTVR